MVKTKGWYIALCVLVIIGGLSMACFVLSGDFNLPNKDVHQEYYWTIPPIILGVFGIALVAGLVAWLARRHPKLPAQFERTGILWVLALNGIVWALCSGIVLYRHVPVIRNLWRAGGDVLQNGSKQPFLSLLGLKELEPLLFAVLCIVVSGLWWRNFIDTWRTPKAPKTEDDGRESQRDSIY
jgi:hypothetical protein